MRPGTPLQDKNIGRDFLNRIPTAQEVNGTTDTGFHEIEKLPDSKRNHQSSEKSIHGMGEKYLPPVNQTEDQYLEHTKNPPCKKKKKIKKAVKILKWATETRKAAWWLKAIATLLEYLSSVPGTHTRQLTTACDSSIKGFDPSSALQALVDTQTDRQTSHT